MFFVFALTFTPLLAADATTFDLVARAEARGDSPASGSNGPVSRILQLDGGASASSSVAEWRLSASYQPRLLVTAPDFAGKDLVNVLSNGRLSVEYLISRLQKLSLEQTVSYGRQDFSPLHGVAPGAPPPTVPIDPRRPALDLLTVLSSITSLSYAQAVTPRLTLAGRAAIQVGGGADTAAQAYLPQQRGVPADASVSWQASKHDRISFELGGSTFAFSNGNRTSLAKASAAWKTDLGPSLSADLGFGGGSTLTSTLGNSNGWQATYLATAGLTSGLLFGRQKLTGTVGGSVNTVIDQLIGAPYRLATLVAAIGYEPLNVLRFTASASAGRALSGAAEHGQTLALADAAANWQAARDVSFAVGARFASTSGGGTAGALPHSTQWAGYAAITWVPSSRAVFAERAQ